MKVLLLNRSDRTGGAAVACMRLLNALRSEGVEATLVVLEKKTNHNSVKSIANTRYCHYKGLFNLALEKAMFWFLEANKSIRFAFSLSNTGEDIISIIKKEKPDIIHLHWFNQGFISLSQLKKIMSLGIPIVWTLHDCWAFTGGCHYPSDCEGFIRECGGCPFLKTPKIHDVSFRQLQYKKNIYSFARLQIVTCSKWLALEAQSSTLLRELPVQNIPNPIDIEAFVPLDKKQARIKLGLDPNKFYLLFGAGNIHDKRKGLNFLFEALVILAQNSQFPINQVSILIFGKGELPENLGFASHHFSTISETETLVNLYSAADAFVLPSLEDNLPNTVMESLACGTPVVAFASGGVPEMVVDTKTGYLVNPANSQHLAECIVKMLFQSNKVEMDIAARQFVMGNYNPSIVARQYISIYSQLLL